MPRVFLVVLDSVGYKLFCEANTPNLDSIGEIHLAYSDSRITPGSFASLLSGRLPICSIPGCYHNTLFKERNNPFFLEKMAEKRTVYVYTSNPWVQLLLRRHRRHRRHPRIKIKTYDTNAYVKNVVKEVKDQKVPYFTIIHVMETHYPYATERIVEWPLDLDSVSPQVWRERQIQALEYVDKTLGFLREMERVIVTSDHSEIFGEDQTYLHDPPFFSAEIFHVPIISNLKEPI